MPTPAGSAGAALGASLNATPAPAVGGGSGAGLFGDLGGLLGGGGLGGLLGGGFGLGGGYSSSASTSVSVPFLNNANFEVGSSGNQGGATQTSDPTSSASTAQPGGAGAGGYPPIYIENSPPNTALNSTYALAAAGLILVLLTTILNRR